ncbi:hypothetical protein [Aquibium sp. ELW1220]|uniref:hypothetical protein n=1 Tax=Aquibium sp. ELW1220 TaxID=2976766 RepID=UPI0025B1A816|nr:hypothetical protein [Aquibium sp. ELW1220]MDN2580877.1 hypothetical protein [Aquibium sp. ELW1220]
MISPIRWTLTFLTAGSLVMTAGTVLPQAYMVGRVLLDWSDAHEVAVYRLSRLGPDDYESAIEDALEARDFEVAASMVALARQHQVELRSDLVESVEAGDDSTALETASDAWDGFISGEASNEAALSGAIAADLLGYGDIRDLTVQAKAYMAGEPTDQVTLMVSSAGLVLTGATIFSLGGASPVTVSAKAGLSTIKVAQRTGKLSAGLVDDIAILARNSIDKEALDVLGRASTRFDVRAMLAAAKALVKPDTVNKLSDLGKDVSAIGQNGGYRGVLRVLDRADSLEDVNQAARLSERFGRGSLAALHFTGKLSLKLGSIIYHLLGWLLSLLVWVLGAFWLLVRFGLWTSRSIKVALAG